MSNFWKSLSKPFLVLAPMQDVTDFAFREIVTTKLAKPDVFFTEFTNTEGLFSRGREVVIRNLKYSEKQRPIVAQIWGTQPENFYKAAALIKELGFDGIDINMGCPDRGVVRLGSGASLIRNESLAKELIIAVKEGARGVPLSIKTRIGFNDVSTEKWIGFLLEQKLDAITIHARIAKERSKYPADWKEIHKAVTLKRQLSPDTVIIGNGDVQSFQEAVQKADEYGVDGVMIGRGIFSNPWVFDKSDEPLTHTTQEYLALLLEHTRLFEDTWGKNKNFEIMKKFFKIYVTSFAGSAHLKERLMKCRNYEEVKTIMDSIPLSNSLIERQKLSIKSKE